MNQHSETLLETAIANLTQPWQHIIPPSDDNTEYRVIDHDARIEMLRNMISSSLGGTTSGRTSSSERSVLNITALDLWQRIDEQTKSALTGLGIKPPKDAAEALRILGTAGDTHRRANTITERDHDRLIAKATAWVDAIDNLLDPPTTKELVGACPKCGTEHIETQEGRSRSLIAYYWKGQEPAARCQQCEAHWQGARQLLELGFSLNATTQHDELRLMGVM